MPAKDFINMKLKTGDVLIKLRKDLAPNHVERISHLVKDGFYDVINFPFSPCQGSNSIPLDNPVDSNKNFLRKNLRDSLINNLEFNQKRQKDSIKFFEISEIFLKPISCATLTVIKFLDFSIPFLNVDGP